jgi:hypothetical protein
MLIIRRLNPMTLSPLVLAILAVCWTLPAALIIVRYGIERAAPASKEVVRREMDTTHKTIAVKGEIDVAAGRERRPDLLYAGSYGDVARTEAASPKSVETKQSVPYAKASVGVLDGAETVRRQCSICLN